MSILHTVQNLARQAAGKNYPGAVAVSGPNMRTIEFVRGTRAERIAEIGIYRGHTSLEFARYLDGKGELHLFDFEDVATRVRDELAAAGYGNVKAFGSSYLYLDSYNWSLAKILERNTEPIYDYVFLDGAHTWAVDALTVFLADKLLKVGGHIDFDDYDWTLQESPSLNPRVFPLTARMYTPEQIAAPQVRMIIELIVRRDPRYVERVPNKIFEKLA